MRQHIYSSCQFIINYHTQQSRVMPWSVHFNLFGYIQLLQRNHNTVISTNFPTYIHHARLSYIKKSSSRVYTPQQYGPAQLKTKNIHRILTIFVFALICER